MAKTEPVYRKLRGTRSSGIGQTRRLWLGSDHLLAVSSAYGFERYRRFYFGDIRALVIRLTPLRLIWNVVLGVLAGLVLVGAAACGASASKGGYDAQTTWVFFWILAGVGSLLLLALALNSAFGATCEMYIQTLAGLEPLGAPRRLRGAQRLQAQLAPLIEALQVRPPPLPVEAPAAAPLPTP